MVRFINIKNLLYPEEVVSFAKRRCRMKKRTTSKNKMEKKEVLPKNIDLKKYVGQWVVICNDELVAHNKDLTKIKKEISKCKVAPTIAKIPKKEILIF